ncbi:hypothetical protein LEN26_013219 [Aphanomyces euteiches]|nr:hypothetical protein LEN26_013219 [Aphanomyces euteiches]
MFRALVVMFSAANALSSVPTQVSVCRDATYDVIGKICSGYGSKPIVDICPRQGTIASDDCHDKLPSWSVVARSCVAREDAVCLLLPSGTWGCVFPSVGCEEIKSANGPTQIPRRKLKRKMQCDSVDNLPTWSSATIQADEAPDVAPDMHDDVETTWFTSETSVIQYEVACLSGAVPQDLKTKPPSLQSPPLSLNLTDAVDKATPETMSVRAESPSASSSTTATMAHSSVDPMLAFVEADQLKQPFRNEDVALHTSSNTPTTQVTQGIQLPTHNNMTPSTNPQPSQDAPTTAKPPLPGQSVAPKPSSPATGDPGGSTPPPSPEEPPTTPKETHSSPAIPHPPSTADFKTPSHYVTIFPPPTPDQSLEPKPQSTPLGDSTHEPKGTPSTRQSPRRLQSYLALQRNRRHREDHILHWKLPRIQHPVEVPHRPAYLNLTQLQEHLEIPYAIPSQRPRRRLVYVSCHSCIHLCASTHSIFTTRYSSFNIKTSNRSQPPYNFTTTTTTTTVNSTNIIRPSTPEIN